MPTLLKACRLSNLFHAPHVHDGRSLSCSNKNAFAFSQLAHGTASPHISLHRATKVESVRHIQIRRQVHTIEHTTTSSKGQPKIVAYHSCHFDEEFRCRVVPKKLLLVAQFCLVELPDWNYLNQQKSMSRWQMKNEDDTAMFMNAGNCVQNSMGLNQCTSYHRAQFSKEVS